MLTAVRSYQEACRTFRWRIPERYNMAFDICDRQTMAGSDGHRTALIVEGCDGAVERYTFHVLRLLSNRLANVLTQRGVVPGDRILVCFPPSVEAAIAILGCLKMGAVAVPIQPGLDEAAMAWRLTDSQAVQILSPATSADLWDEMHLADDVFVPYVTGSDDAALLFYDHGQPQPVGVMHAHRGLLGNLPPLEMALGFFPHFGDIFWTASPWMSFEGLLWGVLPAWHHGVTVVASPLPQTPPQALSLMGRHGVRVFYASSTDLLPLAQAASVHPHPLLRAIATGPAPLTAVQHDYVQTVFGFPPHEIWGTIESGAAAANCTELMEVRAGSPGRATPGVTVEAVEPFSGRPLPAETRGMLAVSPGSPGRCLGHWNGPIPEREPYGNGWIPTGISGQRDLDGYIWPQMVPAADPPPLVPVEPAVAAPIRLDGPRADERLPSSTRKKRKK